MISPISTACVLGDPPHNLRLKLGLDKHRRQTFVLYPVHDFNYGGRANNVAIVGHEG